MSARDVVLGRIRAALGDAAKPGEVPREYRRTFGASGMSTSADDPTHASDSFNA